jgi:hypothetical protein
VAYAYNPSYLGGWDQKDGGLRPAWANRSQDPISKITRAKCTGGVAQVVELLLCKHEALSSKPSPTNNSNNSNNNNNNKANYVIIMI